MEFKILACILLPIRTSKGIQIHPTHKSTPRICGYLAPDLVSLRWEFPMSHEISGPTQSSCQQSREDAWTFRC